MGKSGSSEQSPHFAGSGRVVPSCWKLKLDKFRQKMKLQSSGEIRRPLWGGRLCCGAAVIHPGFGNSWILEMLLRWQLPPRLKMLGAFNRLGYCSFFDAFYKLNKVLPGLLRKVGCRRDVSEWKHPSSPAPLLLLPHPLTPLCEVKCHSREGN